jgi:CheY-like chemotaxis protein
VSPGKPGRPRDPGAAAPLVLLVDDFEDNRAMYAQFLTFSGFRVAEAQNGREALDRAAQLMPDLIVMDLSLPVMDGWEATRRLKGDPRTRGIPIIALTGHALGRHSEGAKDAGCDGFITKPCLPEDLLAEIRRTLGTGPPKTKTRGGS